ncbi:hypothetical protein EIN_249290 [Entamoeba invadens IP1]|uniref:Uncharacterized protein n=1 Tax=Entamoeba invadens IP1 TaxID=370355 RepID=A0A0A1UE78_ENTIV|nr:hypothetical protein EIN_249290 [Entamoeba invadens IP1]ELP94895.1 hypothetical protein EIN_249290 [Entamoeba invadens IP1]|eukprot:XP_004261666.1 hypothetical protein EIN_249290 [Entamoeba invadens IP1]
MQQPPRFEEVIEQIERKEPKVVVKGTFDDFIVFLRKNVERTNAQTLSSIFDLFLTSCSEKIKMKVKVSVSCLIKERSVVSLKMLQVIITSSLFYEKFDILDVLSELFDFQGNTLFNTFDVFNTSSDDLQCKVVQLRSDEIHQREYIVALGRLCYSIHLKGGLVLFITILINHFESHVLFPVSLELSPINVCAIFNTLVYVLLEYGETVSEKDLPEKYTKGVLLFPPKPLPFPETQKQNDAQQTEINSFKFYVKMLYFENGKVDTLLKRVLLFVHTYYITNLKLFVRRCSKLFMNVKLPHELQNEFLMDYSLYFLAFEIENLIRILFVLEKIKATEETTCFVNDALFIIKLMSQHVHEIPDVLVQKFFERSDVYITSLISSKEKYSLYGEELIQTLYHYIPSRVLEAKESTQFDMGKLLTQDVMRLFINSFETKSFAFVFNLLRFSYPTPFYFLTGSKRVFSVYIAIGIYIHPFITQNVDQIVLGLLQKSENGFEVCCERVEMSKKFIDHLVIGTQTVDFIYFILIQNPIKEDVIHHLQIILQSVLILLRSVNSNKFIVFPFKTKFLKILTLTCLQLLVLVRQSNSHFLFNQNDTALVKNFLSYISFTNDGAKCFALNIGSDVPPYLSGPTLEHHDCDIIVDGVQQLKDATDLFTL